MMKARNKGLHAVIRNNQLFIEGKQIINKEYNNNKKDESFYIKDNVENNIYQLNLPNKTTHDVCTNSHFFRKQRPII